MLDVIDDEELLVNATSTGAILGDASRTSLADRHEVIGHVQGSGLFWGLDLVADRGDSRADRLRRRQAAGDRPATVAGILTGITGRYTNVLKIRPPLPFATQHVELLIGALDEALSGLELRGGDDTRALGAEW